MPAPSREEEPDEQQGPFALLTRSKLLLDRARKRACASAAFRRQGRVVLAQMQAKRSADILSTLLEGDPGNLSAHFLLTSCLLQVGDFRAAKEQALQALKICGELEGSLQDPALHLALAYATLRLGDAKKAATELQDVPDLFPQHPQTSLALSRALEGAGRHREAREAALEAVRRDSSPSCPIRLVARQRQCAELRAQRCGELAREQPETGKELTSATPRSIAGASESSIWEAPTPSEAAPGFVVLGVRPSTTTVPRKAVRPGATVVSRCWGLPEARQGRMSTPGARATSALVSPKVWRAAGDCGPKLLSPSERGSMSPRVRRMPFGPQAETGSNWASDTLFREAALQDLEALFANLLPSNITQQDQFGPVETTSFGPDDSTPFGCCSCRRRSFQVQQESAVNDSQGGI